MDYKMGDLAKVATCMHETAYLAANTILKYQAGLGILGGSLRDSEKFMKAIEEIQSLLGEAGNLEVSEERVTKVIGGDNVYRRLQIAITNGKMREEFPVGTILPNIWTDPKTHKKYEMPFRIMNYQKAKLADGREAMVAIICQTVAMPEPMVFDKNYSIGKHDFSFGRSSLKEYLNSDTDGYIAGCEKELRDAMAEIEIEGECVDDGHIVHCKVFLPSPEELHIDRAWLDVPETRKFFRDVEEPSSWEYFLDTPSRMFEFCEKRAFCDPNGNAVCVWLRSVSAGYGIHYVASTGAMNDTLPHLDNSVLPVCAVAGVTTKDVAGES